VTIVGYEDLYPISVIDKVWGAAISFLGVSLFAMPAGIPASGRAEGL